MSSSTSIIPSNDSPSAIGGNASSVLERTFGQLPALNHQSVGAQIAVGAGGGLLFGYLMGKTSKALAVVVGGTLLVIQVAECQGYIKLRRRRFQTDLNAARERLVEMLDNGVEAIRDADDQANRDGGILAHRGSGKELVRFVAQNARLVGGAISGFLVGFGLS